MAWLKRFHHTLTNGMLGGRASTRRSPSVTPGPNPAPPRKIVPLARDRPDAARTDHPEAITRAERSAGARQDGNAASHEVLWKHQRSGVGAGSPAPAHAPRPSAAPSKPPTTVPSYTVGDRIADMYEISHIIHRSPAWTVYCAHHAPWNIDVVLKVPTIELAGDPVKLTAIGEAAAGWNALGMHPQIAYCYYLHALAGVPVLVIEHLDGGNLYAWLAAGHGMRLQDGLDLAIQLCRGLEHAHAAGMSHRALRPDNILLATDGTLKVTDFGIGTPTGTPAYVAPEHWLGAEAIDWRVDVFALGVCLYELFCDQRPFEVTRGPRRDAPEPGPTREGGPLPETLGRLLTSCVDWDRNRRPGSVAQIRRELVELYRTQFGRPYELVVRGDDAADADGWNNRALASELLGKRGQAIEAWDAAVAADPQHLDAAYNRGVARWRAGQATDDEIIGQLATLRVDANDRWRVLHLSALLHLESGQVDEAKELLTVAASLRPGEPELDQALALAQSAGAASGRCLHTLTDHAGYVSSVALSRDGRRAVSGGSDGTVRLWDVARGQGLRTLDGHRSHVSSIGLSADGQLALSGSDDGTLRVWDLRTGQCVHVLEVEVERVFAACLSADGRWALCAAGSKTFVGVEGTNLQLWDVARGKRCAVLEGHVDPVKAVCFSADGRWALSGSDDKTVRQWEIPSGRPGRAFRGHTHFVSAVALSADGRTALSGSWDQTIRLWDVGSGRCLRIFEGHRALVTSACLSSDGRWVLSASMDGTVRLWELETGRCLRTFRGHDGIVSAVSLSDNGRVAVSASWDETVRIWQMPAESKAVCTFRLSRPWRRSQAAVVAHTP